MNIDNENKGIDGCWYLFYHLPALQTRMCTEEIYPIQAMLLSEVINMKNTFDIRYKSDVSKEINPYHSTPVKILLKLTGILMIYFVYPLHTRQ